MLVAVLSLMAFSSSAWARGRGDLRAATVVWAYARALGVGDAATVCRLTHGGAGNPTCTRSVAERLAPRADDKNKRLVRARITSAVFVREGGFVRADVTVRFWRADGSRHTLRDRWWLESNPRRYVLKAGRLGSLAFNSLNPGASDIPVTGAQAQRAAALSPEIACPPTSDALALPRDSVLDFSLRNPFRPHPGQRRLPWLDAVSLTPGKTSSGRSCFSVRTAAPLRPATDVAVEVADLRASRSTASGNARVDGHGHIYGRGAFRVGADGGGLVFELPSEFDDRALRVSVFVASTQIYEPLLRRPVNAQDPSASLILRRGAGADGGS